MSLSKKNTAHSVSRRHALFGGGVGMATLLKSLATGLPPAWLTVSGLAHAQEMGMTIPKKLIMSTSRAGDPVNINCPGSVANGHSPNPNLEYRKANFGQSRQVRSATEWGDLPQQLKNRLAFVHYESLTAAHPEFLKAMTLHGSVTAAESTSSDMLSSALASMYPLGICKQVEPIPLSEDPVTFSGQPLQTVKPSRLKQLFAEQEAELVDLRRIRDEALDELYQGLRAQGTRPQKKFLDRYITSRDQARSIGNDLGDLLTDLSTNEDLRDGAGDQIIAAVALAKLQIAPVINLKIPFGGDNHNDSDLTQEAAQTRSGIGHIANLWQRLGQANLRDDVNFAMLNVFGRTFDRNGSGGRNHNRYHSVMITFGPGVQGGVFGGATREGRARNINPNNGEAMNSGGILAANGLVAAGATLALTLGHDQDRVRERIRDAQFIPAMVRS